MLMKKDYLNLRAKSKLLLLALLALFAGGMSPAWAQVTESFEFATDGETAISISEDAMKLSNGWTVVGSGSYAGIVTSGYSKTLKLQTSGARSGNCIYAGSNSAVYIVCPFEVSGTLSFFWKRNDGSGTVKIYAAEKDGETYTIGSLLATADKTTATNTSSYFEYSTDLGADPIYVAFLLNYAYLDDVTYTAYVDDGSIKKPKALTVSDVTANSAVLSWTAGGTETAWEVSYSTTSGNPDNGTIVSANVATYTLTGLTAETTYYAAVRAKNGEDVSSWTSEVSFTPTKAKALTVNDETSTNSYVPIYGNYVDYYDKVEFIIPAADLTDMANSDIKALKFYLSSPAATSWGNANFKIYMTEVENTTVSSYTFNDDDFTALYNGSLDGTQSEMDITLTTPYSYNGGNLLIGVYNTVKGSYKSASFYGVSAENGTSAYGTNSSSLASVTTVNKQSFLPKTTFTYLPVDGPVMKVSDTAFDFGTLTAESTNEAKTKTFTISNKGTETLQNISVTYSGDDVFSLSDGIATSIAANGEDITVTVTMNASVAGTYNGTITIKADGQKDATISLTGVYAAAPATMALTLGEATVGETVAFGNVGKSITKTFTVTNDGNLKLNINSITSNNAAFTVSPASLEVAGKSSETFTVTFAYDAENLGTEKTANIIVTPSNEGLSPVTFAVTATSVEMWSEDFSGNALPEGWETTNTTYWTFADGVAKSSFSSTNYYLITPSLTVEEGASLSFDVRSVGTWNTLTIEKQLNNGSWTSCKDIASNADFGNDTETWKTFTIDGLEAGNYKFRFNARNFWLDNFEGFKRNMNDPKLGIYTDAECTIAAATSVTKDFGFATETQTATYYIKNDGTGTMTLALGDAPEGLTQNLDKTSVAAGEKATLTITMPAADNKGYHGGNVVVTATDLGTFTVAASGVVVDENKLNLNFATDNIPSTWTANDWMKDANGYIKTGESGYSNTSMETTKLTAEAGEKLIVVAKNGSGSSYYTFGIKYKKADAAEWSDLVAATNIGTSWTTLVATIAEAGEYLLQFNGYYANIQRIYGLSMPLEPVMVVYDGENVAAATYNFGSVANDADAVKTFSVKNEGVAALEGLTATLTGEQAAHYSVAVTGLTDGNLPAGETATVTVTQKKDNLGTHAATLTISATSEGIADKVIALSGTTRDASKLYADFASGIPSGWTATSWSASNGYAQSAYSGTCTLQTPAITVAAGEELTVDLSKYYNNNNAQLKVRYTLDGGITWAEQELNSDLTYGNFTTKTLSLGNAETVTAVLQFVGTYYARLDNFYGGVATTAPMIALTENAAAVENGSTKEFGTLTAQATATYTLKNNGTAAMVSTVATTGVATAAITGEGEGITIDDNTVTLAAGKSATITLTLPYAAPYGEKTGAMTITTEGWVGDFTVNYTATTVDPTALYVNFDDEQAWPDGWYHASDWTVANNSADYYLRNYNSSKASDFITQMLTVAGTDDALTFKAAAYGTYYTPNLTVSYSADRKNWTEIATQPTDFTTSYKTFTVSGIPAGDYYLKFSGNYLYIDEIAGWHKVTGIEHDLYVSATTFPTETLTPGTVDGVTASATVNSLLAAETGVYAKLFFDEMEIAAAEGQDIAKDGSKTFNFTGNVPATEKTYAAKIVVYYSNNSVAFETATTDVKAQHTRTLSVTEFARTSDANATADANNQIDATFTVKVKNTGTVELTAEQVSASILINSAEGDVQLTQAAEDALYVNGEVVITLTGKVSGGAGGEVSYYAKENLTNTVFETAQTITVEAYGAEFAINTDGSTQDFGLATVGDEATTKSYTITNSGNASMNVTITAPEGYAPSITSSTGRFFKFTNNPGWENIYVTTYDSEWGVIGTSWPGAQMTEKFNDGANDVYTINLPAGTYYAIINDNNGNQTSNISDFDTEGYWMDGETLKKWTSNAKCMTIAAGETGTFSIAMNTEAAGVKSGNVTVTTNALNTTEFEIPVTGRVISADTWTEDFAGNKLPTGWDANETYWTFADGVVKGKYNTSSRSDYLTTPILTIAGTSDLLTFDYKATANYVSVPVQVSKDGGAWETCTAVSTIGSLSNGDAGTATITGLEAGDYQFRFGNDDYNLDNFVGFQLNLPDHMAVISAYSIPESPSYSITMKEGQSFDATVTVKEQRGVAEELTAKLYMGETVIGTATDNVEANGTKVLNITATPTVAATSGAQMHIEVEWAGTTLATENVTRYVAAITNLTLDETSSESIVAGTYDNVTLKRIFAEGWNTVCLPFTISDVEGFFGAGAKAYEFTSFTDGNTLGFTTTAKLTASYPYIVYIPAAITEDIVLHNITIASNDATGWYSYKGDYPSYAYFRGTYAPVGAGNWTKNAETNVVYGVTSAAKIQKAGANASIKGFRAYFDLPASVSGARLSFFDETTGITRVFAADEMPEGVFNLNGQKVEKVKKGLYIINGKKTVRK